MDKEEWYVYVYSGILATKKKEILPFAMKGMDGSREHYSW